VDPLCRKKQMWINLPSRKCQFLL